jgi:UDP-N-acetylmuramate dehydrogenase
MKKVIGDLKKLNIGVIKENVLLKNYTTYKVGGKATAFVYPNSVDSLIKLLDFLKNNKIKHMVLGKGSNVIFNDDGYKGIIIKLDNLNNYSIKGTTVKAEAGVSIISLSFDTINHSLQGLDFACGVPGSVGGCTYMNAGCYNSSMSDVIKEVKVLSPNLKVITMKNKDLNFGYRESFFKYNKDYIVLEVTFKLKKGNKDELKDLADDRKRRRLESQPLDYPSAGSVFRNPPNNFSGKLIEDLGLKGYSIGGAKVSEKHANFIINYDNASASDIRDLINYVHDEVNKKYGIDLIVEQEFID